MYRNKFRGQRHLVQALAMVTYLTSLYGDESGTIHHSADTVEEVAGSIELFLTVNPGLKDENAKILEATPRFSSVMRIVKVSFHSEVLI
jgi:hypothetical protein